MKNNEKATKKTAAIKKFIAMSGSEVQKEICKMEVLRMNYVCENVKYLFKNWEIDVCALNKTLYLTEYEVKISRSDFKADAKKRKWIYYKKRMENFIPNYFYYACPQDLIAKEEIPEYAGLIYITPKGLDIIKRAPLLHKKKQNKLTILAKFIRVMSERLYL
ncbi:MAG: MmcB family DNA repair protein [Chitinophagales bacterium]|jgi:hypothetical protein|nr:MmcB family DNA repair protein [Chitinophagales bacterium]